MAEKQVDRNRAFRDPRRLPAYVLLLIALALLAAVLTASIGFSVDGNDLMFLVIFAVVIALLAEILRGPIQQAVDKYIYRRPVTLENAWREFEQEIATAADIEQLVTSVSETIETAVPGSKARLFLPDDSGNGYSDRHNGGGITVPATSTLIPLMLGAPLEAITAGDPHHPAASIESHRPEPGLERLEAAVIVPMVKDQDLLGWIAVSRNRVGSSFSPAELDFLTGVAKRSLLNLEQANLIRRLEARISELDILSQYSQYLNFTIVFDDLLELLYTNLHRMFSFDDFYVYWRDLETGDVYTIFSIRGDERIREEEGRHCSVSDPNILQVFEPSQISASWKENQHTNTVITLNSGADTLGALHAVFHDQSFTLSESQEQLLNVFADRAAIALDRLYTRQQLETRAKQLEIINQVTFSLASTLELEPLLNLILDRAIELLETEAGTFMLTDEDTGELVFRVVRGPTSQDLIGRRLPVGTGLAGTAAQTGRPILVNRVQEDKRWFAQVDASTDFHSQSILTVPMLRLNTVLGVLQVINKKDGAPFNEEDQMLLTAFAGQAVVALENARLLEQTDRELQERVNELFMLQQLDRDLNTSLELNHVLNLTLDWILRICHGTAGAIVLADDDGNLQVEAVRGNDESFDPHSLDDDQLRRGLIGSVFESGQPHVTGNVHEEPTHVAISFDIHSQITVPIINKQNLIGVIVIGSDRFDAFDESSVETAVRVTNHAAVAIANALLVEQVNEANLAKSEFVSLVSHELKTPMTSIRGYTDLLLSGMTGELSDQQKSFLETIASNISRVSKQVQDLTDISRIETGQLHIELAPTAFSNIVSETLQIVQGPCDDKNIELHLDLPADLPLVLADKERIVQVLTNLLSNACKYSPPDTEVFVSVKPEGVVMTADDPPIPAILCSVKDNGYGISEEDQRKLFTKFFRAEDPNIRKSTGTGLGLSITKGIIEFHGGMIWVESELGKETTFHFAIPQASE